MAGIHQPIRDGEYDLYTATELCCGNAEQEPESRTCHWRVKLKPAAIGMKVDRNEATIDFVADLVRLRRWALRCLSAPSYATGNDIFPTPKVQADAWPYFFELERCASSLLAFVTARGETVALPAHVRSLIISLAKNETRIVLHAERVARRLGVAAEAAGTNVVVLKGVLPALTGASSLFRVADLDVLATDESVHVIEAALVAAGYTRAEHNETHHTYWAAPAGGLPVEVHWTTHTDGTPLDAGVWSRTVPLDGALGLNRLAWSDQLLHLLEHRLIQHGTHGHVNIRDVLLIGWCADQLDEPERRMLEKGIAASTDPSRYRTLLHFAETLRESRSVADPFEEEAMLHFAAALLLRNGSLGSYGRTMPWHGMATVASGKTSFLSFLGSAARSPVTGVTRFASIQLRLPRVGAAVTRATRAAHYLVSLSLGVPRLLAIRRAVKTRL